MVSWFHTTAHKATVVQLKMCTFHYKERKHSVLSLLFGVVQIHRTVQALFAQNLENKFLWISETGLFLNFK